MGLYPPIIIQHKESVKVEDLIKMRRDPRKLLMGLFFPKKYKQLTRQGIKDRMNPKHQKNHLIEDFTIARPELAEEFRKALNENFKAA
ncbi:Uncharacterised protein [uncultured archaeon]|nr:Uncharacterised protein [uncultured archaeon]